MKRIIALALCLLMPIAVFAADAPAREQPAAQTKTHHKVLAAVMIVSGVALAGFSAVAFSRGCPAQERAQQIGLEICQIVTSSGCGSSWLEHNKNVIGGTTAGAGAALVVSGVVLLRK